MKYEKVGTEENPHLIAPVDWCENGVEYGAWCKCARCGLIEMSTFLFDYYAIAGPGSALLCETCCFNVPANLPELLRQQLPEEETP